MVLFTALSGAAAESQLSGYTTSWLGNTWGGLPQYAYPNSDCGTLDTHMTNSITDIAATPNGYFVCNSPYEEGQVWCPIFDTNGNFLGFLDYPVGLTGFGYFDGGAVAANNSYAWATLAIRNSLGQVTNGQVAVYSMTPNSQGNPGQYIGPFANLSSATIQGLAINSAGTALYVSCNAENLIEVVNPTTLAVQSSFSVTNPGQLTVDGNGNLWVLQYGIANGGTRKVMCYNPSNGTQLGTISFAAQVNPLDISASGTSLYVADGSFYYDVSGTAHGSRVQIYNVSNPGSPTLSNYFGTDGGIHAAPDGQPTADGLKLNVPRCLAVDGSGNISIFCNAFQYDGDVNPADGNPSQLVGGQGEMESFNSSGTLRWIRYCTEFMDNASIDPGDETSVYTARNHYTMNWSNTTPGSEWGYTGYIADYQLFPNDPRVALGCGGTRVMRINGQPFLQIKAGTVCPLYRFESSIYGEIAVPSVVFGWSPGMSNAILNWAPNQPGGYNEQWIWTDSNGNGQFDAGEYQIYSANTLGGYGEWTFDDNGNAYYAGGQYGTQAGNIWELTCQGLDSVGNPSYTPAGASSYAPPNPGDWLRTFEVLYDMTANHNDTMYVAGYTSSYPGYVGDTNTALNNIGFRVLRAYGQWSTYHGTNAPLWTVVLPFLRTAGSTGDFPVYLAEAGDYLFFNYFYECASGLPSGTVHVMRKSDGVEIGLLSPTPGSVSPTTGWIDIFGGVSAYQRSNGEYDIFVEDDWDSKTLIYRWTPGGSGVCATPNFSPAASTYSSAQTVTISTTTSGATINYTTNGTTPSASVGTPYSSPVAISANTTLQAIAYETGYTNSSVASGVYTITGGSLTNFFTTSYTGTRNNFPGSLGFEFTPTQTLTVTALGRSVSGSMNNSHTIYIWQVSNPSSPLTSATVTPSSPTDSLGYKYVTITPVQLTSGTTYRIASDETSGGDNWMDSSSITNHSALATISQAVYSSTAGTYPSDTGTGANTGYVPPTFYTGSGATQCATPTFNPTAGNYGSAQSVTISTTTGGATIYYTTNGTTPSSTNGTVYSSPLSINATTTLQAIAYETGYSNSAVASGVFIINGPCANPTFNPAAGTYSSAQSVTISTTTGGATINYTTNGTTPSSTVGTVYNSPVAISATSTLQAIAYENGYTNSAVASGVYTINSSTLTNFFTASYTGTRNNYPGTLGFNFTPSQNITVTALGRSVSGSMNNNHNLYIWLTSNQSLVTSATVTPSSSVDSLGYAYVTITPVQLTSGISYCISSDETSGGDEWMDAGVISSHSGIATINNAVYGNTGSFPSNPDYSTNYGYVPPTFYVGTTQCVMPTFNPVAGTYSSAQSVTISTTTGGATIYYTTNGTTPSSTNGTVYSSPLSINATTTLQAIAYENGYSNSAVASGVYTINGPCANPTFNPAASTYSSAQSVTISTTTGGATIMYTTDGTTPSPSVGTVYNSPVAISATSTLQAIAYESGYTNSAVTSGVYTITSGTLTNFFTASYTGTRNNFTGSLGFEFTPTQNLTVTALGRSVSGSMNNSHTIYIWQVSNPSSPLTSATVTPSSPTDSLGYKYVTITPVQLTSGTTYRISSDETSGGDNWMDSSSITNHSAIATISQAVYSSTAGTYPSNTGTGANTGYVPPTFYTGSSQCATSYTIDTSTEGSWWSSGGGYLYGSLGYVLCDWNNGSDVVNLSGSYVSSVTPSGQSGWCWAAAPQSSTAATINPATDTRAAACWYSGSNFTVQIALDNPNDGIAHRMAVYCLDWDNDGRVETVDLENPSTSALLLSGGPVTVSSFNNGTWVDFTFYGNVQLKITCTAGANAVISAIAFDNQVDPTFSPAPGTYTSAQNVTITANPIEATIRYTINGPTPSSTVGWIYSSPVNISANTTLEAIAYMTGYANSPLMIGNYTIQCVAPIFNPAAGAYGPAQSVTISTTTSGANINYTTDGTTPSSTSGTVYSSPVSISATATLQAIAYETGLTNSTVTSGIYTINATCATPTFSPTAGTFTTSTAVTISTTTGGATIRYTTDGTTPSSTSGTVYSSAVSITSTSTLQAIAYKTGLTNSAVVSGVYTVQCSAPSFNPAAGPYLSTQSVTISTTTSGASIRYTTNGTTPSSTVGTVYSSAVSISATGTLQAIAYKTGLTNSSVTTGVYTIDGTCATPSFSPAAGTDTTSTSVTISTTTGGATIRYTTNGTTPSSTVGTVYSSAVSITSTSTLKAIAYETGYNNSAVASGVYTIQCAAPTFNPAAGTYTTSTLVSITTTTSGASIRYTTNGTTPSSTVGTVYSSAVSITSTSTLQAIAYETGLTNSAVTTGVYTIMSASPTFNPVAGTYSSTQTVTISTITSGASIRYTTNGTTPSSTVGTVYSSAVSISSTSTLQAIAYKTGLTNSAVVSGVYTIATVCATPTFNPLAGTYSSTQTVTIGTTTSGASIRYTTNGTTPSSTVGTVYSSAVSISANSTLMAIAYKSGLTNSAVASSNYTIQCAAPTFNPVAGTYGTTQTVTISTATSGASIRYTTNGTTPSSTVGTVYSSAVSINANTTLQAIAYESGMTNSAVASGNYFIQCAVPTFSPGAATYDSTQTVTISTTTSGASIRYTTNGTTPTSTLGTVYSSAISISATATLQAIAYATGMTNSAVTSATYTIDTLPSGMLLWLNAEAITGVNSGGSLTTWTDQSGNGYNAVYTNPNGEVAPTYVTNVYNGMPVVRFAGDNLLQISALPLGSYTIATVFKTTGNSQIVYEHSDDLLANTNGNFLYTSTQSTISVKRGGTQTGKDILGSGAGTWAANCSTPILTVDEFGGTDAGEVLYMNGAQQQLLENWTGGLNTTTVYSEPFNIGERASYGGLQFNGDIAEIVIYGSALSGTNLSTLTNALMAKYALDNPPTVSITAPTNNSSYTAPASITITASATANTGSISKVEFYDGNILLGTATSSPYSITWSNAEHEGSMGFPLTAKVYDSAGFATVSSPITITVNDSNLKAYWKFGEDTGITANDTSGNGNTGTVSNGTWGPGKLDCCLVFNGTSSSVADTSASGLPAANAAQTESFWMYVSATPSAEATALAVSGSSSGVYIGYNSSTTFGVWTNGGTLLVSTTTLPSTGAWHLITYTLSGGTNTLYIDGTSVSTSTTATNTGAATALTAGMTPGGSNYFTGDLEMIRVYNRALSAAEISGLAAGKQ